MNGGENMLCPNCKNATKVCDTRFDEKENEVFRRHACKECGTEFFTVEFAVENNNKFASIWKLLSRGSGSRPGGRKL